jgi:hypothetical protein
MMPPLLVPPVVAGALGVLGAVALAKLVAREWRRINDDLDPETAVGDDRPRLRRDPASGVFRPDDVKRER